MAKDFIVTVVRTAHGSRDFRVKGATNETEARKLALEKAGNFVFSEKESDYTCEGVIAISGKDKTNIEVIQK